MFKILIIGDPGVGKSSLLLRFADNKFNYDYRSTIGIDYRIRRCPSSHGNVELRMYDTAGQERFRSITASYYRGVHGFMVVYDVTDATSFYHITQWLKEIQRHAEVENVCVLLVGNKCDREKIVHKEQEYANSHGISFIETSAKDGTNVEESFKALADDLTVIDEQGPKIEDRTFSSLRFVIPNRCAHDEQIISIGENSKELEIETKRKKKCSSCS